MISSYEFQNNTLILRDQSGLEISDFLVLDYYGSDRTEHPDQKSEYTDKMLPHIDLEHSFFIRSGDISAKMILFENGRFNTYNRLSIDIFASESFVIRFDFPKNLTKKFKKDLAKVLGKELP